MKGIVADLVVGTHSENRLARRLKGRTMDFGGRGVSCVTSFPMPSCEAHCKSLPDCIRNRRSIMLERRESGA
jgi:hypothetical protein